MSITSAQFAKLSDYYGFDLAEAREFLGLPAKSKQGRPSSTSNENKSVPKPKAVKPKAEKPKAAKPKAVKPKAAKPKAVKPKDSGEKRKRGPTGYQMFLKDYHPVAKAKMQAKLKSGEKLSGGDVLKAVGAEWRELSDSGRASWNAIAA